MQSLCIVNSSYTMLTSTSSVCLIRPASDAGKPTSETTWRSSDTVLASSPVQSCATASRRRLHVFQTFAHASSLLRIKLRHAAGKIIPGNDTQRTGAHWQRSNHYPPQKSTVDQEISERLSATCHKLPPCRVYLTMTVHIKKNSDIKVK
jgi:hypothetical protein